MGILDFFKGNMKSKSDNVETPDELKYLISKDDFNSILTFATTHLTNKGHTNISFADGLLLYETLEEGGTRNQTNFLNLVKSVLCEERKDWQIKTVEYLENLNQDKELESEILLNFEKAKEYLSVRLHPQKSHIETLVYKVEIPETYSMLALDLPTRFHFLTVDEVNVWSEDKSKLFEIAHNNLRDKIETIQAQQHDWDGAVFYTLFDRDYSAAYCIDFANNCDNLIGEKGSLISFPTRGSVFVHPISDNGQFNIGYNHIVEKTNKFFDDDPGPISRNIYWLHENKFTLFEMTWNNGELTYNIPQQLHDLLYR
jgi:hypothetical protein